MENGGNNNNVWWDLAHLGLLGEEEMKGTSRPYDYWTSRSTSNVVLMNSHDHHHDPPRPITISNGGGGGGGGGVAKKMKQYLSSSLYSAGSSHVYPDPHLTCLKLGNPNHNNKRRQYYFEDGTSNIISTTTAAKGKCYTTGGDGVPLLSVGFGFGSSSTVVIPRCQVDGCHVELLCAREYHRRHKVCEVHSKATKVEVLGIQQRFCQQCSRFHVITEFDDSKRSCRRRLAGHNERRRKMSGSNSNSNSNNSSSSSSNDSSTTTITSTTRKCFDQGGAVGLPQTNFPSSRQRVSNECSLSSVNSWGFTGDQPHPW